MKPLQNQHHFEVKLLCLATRQEGSGLPGDLLSLYTEAMTGALRTAGQTDTGALEAALGVMQRVAKANMLAKDGMRSVVRREFTSDDLREVLDDAPPRPASMGSNDRSCVSCQL